MILPFVIKLLSGMVTAALQLAFIQMSYSCPAFKLFSSFSSNLNTMKIVDFNRIWTRIVGEEEGHVDHLSTHFTRISYNFVSLTLFYP